MELFRGEHIVPESTEDFYEICQGLSKKFSGAMRLVGEINKELCQADLLIEEGIIIAASFENLKRREIILKEDALQRVKEKFIGSTGGLELYEFSREDVEGAKKSNKKAMLTSRISIKDLGMQIKSIEKKKILEAEKRKRGILKKIPISTGKRPTKDEIERRIIEGDKESKELEVDIEGIEKIMQSTRDTGKKAQLREEIKKKREELDRKIAERISKLGKKKEIEIPENGEVKTSIDKLFQLLKKYNRLKINDALARKLNVKKSQIEEWGIILEEHNLVELHYPTIGEPEIKIVNK